jgi:glycopeptide antibiotics resistance protein
VSNQADWELFLRSFGYILLALISYASIWPFVFGANAVARLPQLVDIWHQIPTDVVENILAFVPMGVAFRLTEEKHIRRRDFALAAAIAVVLQLIQLWMPNRQPALTDAVWNCVGLAIGAWATSGLRWIGDGPRALSPVGLALMLLFALHLALQLFIWSGEAGAFEKGRLSWEWTSTQGLALLLPWGAALLATLPLLRPRLKTMARLAVAALFLVFAWQGLTPMTGVTMPIQWVPLKGLIHGFSWGLAATLAWKLFVFGALTRLLMLSGLRNGLAMGAVVLLVVLIEVGQHFLGSGSPDVTDPLMALLCAWGVVQEASVHAQRIGGGLRAGLRHFR